MAGDEIVVVDPGRPVGGEGPQLGGVDGGVDVDLGDTRAQVGEDPFDGPAASHAGDVQQVVGEQDALVGGQLAEGKAHDALGRRPGQPHRKPEVDGQLEIDVEELGPQGDRAHVRVEVADVEAPVDRALDLGAELAPDLVEVGVVPHVLDGAGEAAVAVEQRGSLGDRPPAVQVVLGVQRQVHADVLAAVAGSRVTRPRARHHQGGARGHALTQSFVDAQVGGVARPQVVAVDDQELGVRVEAQPLGERCHRP